MQQTRPRNPAARVNKANKIFEKYVMNSRVLPVNLQEGVVADHPVIVYTNRNTSPYDEDWSVITSLIELARLNPIQAAADIVTLKAKVLEARKIAVEADISKVACRLRAHGGIDPSDAKKVMVDVVNSYVLSAEVRRHVLSRVALIWDAVVSTARAVHGDLVEMMEKRRIVGDISNDDIRYADTVTKQSGYRIDAQHRTNLLNVSRDTKWFSVIKFLCCRAAEGDRLLRLPLTK